MKWFEKYKMDLIVGAWEGYRQAILSLLETNPEARLLDLGPGEGTFTRRMAKRVGTRYAQGVELDYKAQKTGATPSNLNEKFPLDDEAFDVVVASHVIEHLWNTDGFIQEIRRVVKSTGYIIISTPNLAAWHNVVYLVLGRQPETAAVSDEMYTWVEVPGHRRIFTATELVKFLIFHGFTVETLIGSTYYPLPTGLAKMACKLDWKHSCMVTVKARKTE